MAMHFVEGSSTGLSIQAAEVTWTPEGLQWYDKATGARGATLRPAPGGFTIEQPVYRHPTPIAGADLFAVRVEAGETPPGIWADWLFERDACRWFAYALRWMEARGRWPGPANLASGHLHWLAFPGDKLPDAASSLIPYPLLTAMPDMRHVIADMFEVVCETFVDAVAAIAVGLESLNATLDVPEGK